MNKKIAFDFLRDKFVIILFYFLNTGLLIIFFHLLLPIQLEIFYPTLLSLFLLTILLVIEWVRFYSFNKQIELKNEDLKPFTKEQSRVAEHLIAVNNRHTMAWNTLHSKHEEQIHFLSQWMHNLKTPISVIDLIIEKYKDKNSEALEQIRVENDHLNHSVDQVLNIIRFDHIAQDFEPKKVNLNDSLTNAINAKKQQFIYQRVFPVIKTNETHHIVTDQKWNEFVLEQLISNAIKYSSKLDKSKQVIFTIKTDEQYTYLSIKDEGIGIPCYDLSRVFEPFFTGENGRMYRKSTGIGLYLSKKIVDRLGHKIEIESKVSEGTEITIRYLSKM